MVKLRGQESRSCSFACSRDDFVLDLEHALARGPTESLERAERHVKRVVADACGTHICIDDMITFGKT